MCEREGEDGILFSMIEGRSADNQVNEKESHLEQRGVGSILVNTTHYKGSSAGFHSDCEPDFTL